MEGLEPPQVAPLVPKTSASTSSATSARTGTVLNLYMHFVYF